MTTQVLARTRARSWCLCFLRKLLRTSYVKRNISYQLHLCRCVLLKAYSTPFPSFSKSRNFLPSMAADRPKLSYAVVEEQLAYSDHMKITRKPELKKPRETKSALPEVSV
eukprot:scaffold24506_cov250-Cylindrotheca_fusiformis.AAC.1